MGKVQHQKQDSKINLLCPNLRITFGNKNTTRNETKESKTFTNNKGRNFWIALLVVFLPELDWSCVRCNEDDTTQKWTQRCRKDWSGQSLEKKHSRVWKLQVKVNTNYSIILLKLWGTSLSAFFSFFAAVIIYFTKGMLRKGKGGRQVVPNHPLPACKQWLFNATEFYFWRDPV